MFKANNQPGLFSFETQLLDNEQQKLLEKTPEKAFYNLIFRIGYHIMSKKLVSIC